MGLQSCPCPQHLSAGFAKVLCVLHNSLFKLRILKLKMLTNDCSSLVHTFHKQETQNERSQILCLGSHSKSVMESEISFKSSHSLPLNSQLPHDILYLAPAQYLLSYLSSLQRFCFPCHKWFRNQDIPRTFVVPRDRITGQEWRCKIQARTNQNPFLRNGSDTVVTHRENHV